MRTMEVKERALEMLPFRSRYIRRSSRIFSISVGFLAQIWSIVKIPSRSKITLFSGSWNAENMAKQ